MERKAFTLVELLLVVAIMGLMGSVSVGGYRAMRRGMEERAVMRNASQFIRSCYQRSQVDGVPVAVYFWNELVSPETEEAAMKVVGRATAVRRNGRITHPTSTGGGFIIDEFGNFEAFKSKRFDGGEDLNATFDANSPCIFLYRINGGETAMRRSRVTASTVRIQGPSLVMLSEESPTGWAPTDGGSPDLYLYGHKIMDKGGIDWEVGDAYGLEFANLELPAGFIFKSQMPSSGSPVADVAVFNFNPASGDDGGGQTIPIYMLRQNEDGGFTAKQLESTETPRQG